MGLIESLNWRYATKKFDRDKKIQSSDIELLKESIRLAATSYGLQPFKVKVIDNQEIKEKLTAPTFGQAQVADCSHVFVFANFTEIRPQYIDKYVDLCAVERDIDISKLQGYGDFMKTTLAKYSDDDIVNWAAKQAYIGMSNLLNACAQLRIDACPIEGFDSKAYNKLFKFDDVNLSTCVVVAVGYRSVDCPNQHLKKVRLPSEAFFL